MSDSVQMTLIADRPTAGDAAVRGLSSEQDLAAAAWAVVRRGALAELSEPEAALVDQFGPLRYGVDPDELVDSIRAEGDPLGEALMRLRPPDRRRVLGATYTPPEIVSAMVGWAASRMPDRVIDPGTGSARFLTAAGRVLPEASLVGVEIDPLAALLARANLTAAGLDDRSQVVVHDYRTADLGECTGATAYLGNPPYVRHHQIEPSDKAWLARRATDLGLKASGLAGLHVHFLLATALHARSGDVGAFVTSAEWLEVNYGRLPRQLVAGELGGVSIHVIDPEATPFDGTATTAAVTCFEVGTAAPSIRLRRVGLPSHLGALESGERFDRKRLRDAPRWSSFLNGNSAPKPPQGWVELGELCRVHRGAVTGSNSTWITEADDPALPPGVLFASITKARELFKADDSVLSDASGLRAVVDLPADLDKFDEDDRTRIDRFLRAAQRRGVHTGYIARNRNPWWSVGLRPPAPILATYMARRPPAFVRNLAGARNVNVAHGIYPREPMEPAALDALAASLRTAAPTAVGRTYAGGLVKFEPSEMSRIPVPPPALLKAAAA